MNVYVLDSNFFIQAHRKFYPLDVVCSFWTKVKQLANERKIISIDKVKNEIFKHNDGLKKWCEENLPNDFFKDTSSLIEEYKSVANWANEKDHYMPKALDEFLDADEADAFLIAYTLHYANNTLVTEEVSDPKRKNKIKIPDVCIPFKVKYLNTIDMFRALHETF